MQGEGVSNRVSGVVYGNAVQAGRIETLNLLPPAPPAPVPWQVPAEHPGFVNRVDELAEMAAVLDRPQDAPLAPIIVLSGPPGVGKSDLSRRFAAREQGRFGDGQLYVPLGAYRGTGGAVDLGDVYSSLLSSLGVDRHALPASTRDRALMYRAVMHGRRALVVLDDVEVASQAQALMPGRDGAMLVTTRHRLEELRGGRTVALAVRPLGPAEGAALLAGQIGVRRVAAEPEQAARLVQLCEGLPLLLRVVGADLVRRPHRALADAVSRLSDAAARNRRFDRAGVFCVLDETYDRLGESAAAVYRVLGLLPGVATSTAVIAVASGLDKTMVEEGVEELMEANLVDEAAGARLAAHAMIRVHALHVAGAVFTEQERTRIVERVLHWYLAAGHAADRAIAPVRLRLPGAAPREPQRALPEFADDASALAWLEDEHQALADCVREAAARDWHETAWSFCDPLWSLYQTRKHYTAWVETFTLAVAAAEHAGSHRAMARLRCLLARAYIELKQFDSAAQTLEPALEQARREGDPQLETSVLEFIGVMQLEDGRPGLALDTIAQARRILAGAGDTADARRGDLILRYLAGRAALAAGRAGSAVRDLEPVYREALGGDARLAGRARMVLAEALLATGEPGRAEPLAVLAVREAGRRAVPVEQVAALRLLSSCCMALGRLEEADQWSERAQAIQTGLEGGSSVTV